MKKFILAALAVLFITVSAQAQESVDSATYETNIATRFKRGIPRRALINMLYETHKVAYLYGYRGDFADSTTLATDIPSPFVFGGYRPYATVGTSFYIWSGSAWTPVSGSGGGSPSVNHDGDFVGDGTSGNPLGVAVDAIGNEELEESAPWTFKGNMSDVTANVTDWTILSLNTFEPATADYLMGWRTADGEVARFDVEDFPVINGTPLQHQIGVWGPFGTLNGFTEFTYNSSTDQFSFGNPEATNPYGSITPGQQVMRLPDNVTAPDGTLGSGGLIYVNDTTLYFHNKNGTIVDLTESNTGAVNIGSGRQNIFKQKTGANLEFYTLFETNYATPIQSGDSVGFNIVAESITSTELGANSVTSSEIAPNSVGTADVVDGTLAEADFDNNELINIFNNAVVTETVTSLAIDDTDVPDRFDVGRIYLDPPSTQTATVNSGVAGDIIFFMNISTQTINFVAGTSSLSDPGSLTSQYEVAKLEYTTASHAVITFLGVGGGTNTNLSVDQQAGSYLVQSSTGTDVDLPLATASLRGIVSGTDKAKLDGIETAATADQTGAEMETALDTQFGDSDWSTTYVKNAQNVGAGHFFFKDLSAQALRFRSLIGVSPITLFTDTPNDEIDISFDILGQTEQLSPISGDKLIIERSAGVFFHVDVLDLPSSGETNLMQNSGVSGVGPFDNKSGVTFNMRNFVGSSSVSATLDDPNNEIDLAVPAGGITTTEIANSTIINADIASNAVEVANMSDESVGKDELNAGPSAIAGEFPHVNSGATNIEWSSLTPPLGSDITVATALDDNDILVPYSYARFHVVPATDGINLTIDNAVAGQWIELTNTHATNTADFLAGAGMTLVNGSAILEPDDLGYIYWESATKARIFVSGAIVGGGGGDAGLPISKTESGTTYTLILEDSISVIERDNALANTTTVPLNSVVALPVGTTATIVWSEGAAGQPEILAAVGVSIFGQVNIDGDWKIAAANASITLYKFATDKWYAWGSFETDGYGAWNNISFSTNWANFPGETAKWRSVIKNGERWIQFNGALISRDAGGDVASDVAFDLTAAGVDNTHLIGSTISELEDVANGWDASGFSFNTLEQFFIQTSDGTGGVEQDDSYWLPTQEIPLF